MTRPRPRVRSGLEVFVAADLAGWKGRRVGLVANQASVASDFQHAVDLLLPRVGLQALFGPEHGLRGEAQDMEGVESSRDPATSLPVHSLYGRTSASLAPRPEALEGLDVLLFDLQDVGARYYTFATTLFYLLEAAAPLGLPVHVLDRPNPLGGSGIEGPGLTPGFASFVGRLATPVRHGLTMGELARHFVAVERLDVDLTVVPVEGWERTMDWDATGLPWVPPSPNMPTVDTAFVYPGGCLLEGTNLSEGRGTTRPFEVLGAPWIDGIRLAEALNRLDLPGVRFRAQWFRPISRKWAGQTCGGVQVHVTDRRTFQPFAAYVACLIEARRQDPERFAWRREEYEFVTDRLAIDLLAGSDGLRAGIESGRPLPDMEAEWKRTCATFAKERRAALLYAETPV